MAEQTLIKVKGIVTRSVQFKENDKIITVLTPDLGLISVYCHGAKSNKSKFLTTSRLFCYSEFVLTRKKDFYYIKEADYIEAFFDIVNSMDKLFLGQYFLEAVNEVCVEGVRQDNVLRLLLNSLYALSRDMCAPSKVKSTFEMRLCAELGLTPDLSACRRCGCIEDEVFYFDLLNGDMICRDCLLSEDSERRYSTDMQTSGTYLPVSMSVIAAIKYISVSKIEKLFSYSLTDDAFEQFAVISEKYLLNQVGKSFITLDLYNDQIKN